MKQVKSGGGRTKADNKVSRRIQKTRVAEKKGGSKLTHKIGDCLIGRKREMGTKAVLATRAITKRVMVGKKRKERQEKRT
jgi:hypothetical protein